MRRAPGNGVILREPTAKPLMEFHQHKIPHPAEKSPSSTFSITINGRCSMDFPLSWKSMVPTTCPFFNGAVSCGSFNVKLAFRFLSCPRGIVTDPASPAPKLTSRLSPNQTRCVTNVASGLIGVTVSKKRKPQVSSFSDSLKRILTRFRPQHDRDQAHIALVAEATRLYPAPAVVPVFMPSTCRLVLHNRRLRFG